DHQVKIRGFRVELGEIESTILTFNKVKEVVVLKTENDNLCAYIVCDDELETREIRNNLKTKLPEYMIPSHFIKVDSIPLTLNGKIDSGKLKEIKIENSHLEKILPRSLQESVIVEIWKSVLGLDEIYVNDDFFELGGNSINIVQVAKEIQERLEIEINIPDLMIYTNVIELAEFIINSSVEQNKYKHIFKINRSTSEEKIFLFHGADGDIFYFRHLAKILEPKYSVYGIQPSGLNGKEPFPLSFYEMLSDYIKEIKRIQPEGPYIFGGYCVGGYLSYDTTRIFELQGEKVKALLEIDQEPFVQKKLYTRVTAFETVLKAVELWRRIT
ncbi:MAG: thioesterase domain-containing protein, partial [Bacillota bacterium]